jgi:restriction endonuclease S subunit
MTDIPNGWHSEPLEKLLSETIGGIWGEESGTSEIEVSVVRVTELKLHGRIDPSTAVTRSITHKQLASRELQEGDLLLEKSGGGPSSPVGRVGYFHQESVRTVCSNFMQLMRPNPEIVIPKYLFYFLNGFHSNGGTIPMQTATTNIRNIKMPQFMAISVPFPPLPEQLKIVEILEDHLSRLDAALADVKLARAKAAQFRRSLLQAAFTGNLGGDGTRLMTDLPKDWKLSTIGEVSEIIRGVTYSKADTLSASDRDAIPLLRATNLEVDSITYEDMVYVPKDVVKTQQILKLNDIFLAASSGSISVVGKSAQVIKTNGETFGAFCAVVRPKNIHPKFLSYWVQSPEVRDHWSATAKGTNINNLKPSDISETRIPIPPLPEQHKIVAILEDYLSRLDASVDSADAMEKQSVELRRSLLQAAFTGQLTNEVVSV